MQGLSTIRPASEAVGLAFALDALDLPWDYEVLAVTKIGKECVVLLKVLAVLGDVEYATYTLGGDDDEQMSCRNGHYFWNPERAFADYTARSKAILMAEMVMAA